MAEIPENKEWCFNWFGSPFYRVLYRHRDVSEARLFVDHLIKHLGLKDGSRILDVGCGTGRHSMCLSEKGFEVFGIDLIKENILLARASLTTSRKVVAGKSNAMAEGQRRHKTIRTSGIIDSSGKTRLRERGRGYSPSFFVHDMRKVFRRNYFDAAVNLFTSFGYFADDDENIKVLRAVNSGLKKKGVFVLDFMNVKKILSRFKLEETKVVGNQRFIISRSVKKGFIHKKIIAGDQVFEERVKLLTQGDFQKYFAVAGFHITDYFGSYDLRNFDEKKSERLIIVANKKQ